MAPLAQHMLRIVVIVVSATTAIGVACAQGLSVLPVTIQLAAGQRAASLTVVNQSTIDTSFQVRPFAWSQHDGVELLAASDAIVVSPPLGTIPPGGTQVIRLILRQVPQSSETSYRLLLDQIPPPAAPGTVQVALRLSLPVFALPITRVAPALSFRVEQGVGTAFLIASNNGKRHEKLQDIELRSGTGTVLPTERGLSPYVLPGAVRRWRIDAPAGLKGVGVRLSASTEVVRIANQPVAVMAIP